MAYTQEERQFIVTIIMQDAQKRRVNESGLIEELLDLLLRPKAEQEEEIARLVGQAEKRHRDQISVFDQEQAKIRTRIEDEVEKLASLKVKVKP